MFHVTRIFPSFHVYGLFPCNRFIGFGVKGMKSTRWSSNHLLTRTHTLIRGYFRVCMCVRVRVCVCVTLVRYVKRFEVSLTVPTPRSDEIDKF